MHTIRLIATFALLAVFSAGFAQVDRSKAPAPAPAPKIKMGKYKAFTLDNGLKVFVVQNDKLPRISMTLTLDLDPILEGEAAGYVSMAGDLMSAGTTNRSKAQIDEEIDFIGGTLSTSSGSIFASSLTKHSGKLLDLMTDVLYNPSFPQEELDKLKTQTISGLAANKNDPNAIAGNVRTALRYGLDHPYGEQVTEETVEKITAEMCRNYYKTYWKPNVAYLIIIGDVKPGAAKKLVEKHFGKWEKGEVPTHEYTVPTAPSKTRVCVVDRPGAVQSVVNVTYPVDLKPGSDGIIHANIMNNILGGGAFSGRLMQNLREDKAYTYGARSSLSSDRVVGSFNAFASVRNEVTDSAVVEFLAEMKKMRDTPVTKDELSKTKNIMNGNFARSLEQPQTIARFALNTALYNLSKDYYATYLERLDAATIDNVADAARKFIKPDNALIVVVGNAGEVAEKLAKFAGSGEVEYFDIYGNPVEPNALEPVPAGVTAEAVVEGYLKAIGGRDALSKITDVKMNMTATIQGMGVEMTVMHKGNNKYMMEMKGMGMTLAKSVYNGTKGHNEQMGQKVEMSAEELASMKMQALLVPEAEFKSMGVKMNLMGIESLNGPKAYKMELTMPDGETEVSYFDVDSGLKVRSLTTQDSPAGPVQAETVYDAYQEVGGLKFPYKVSQTMGPQAFNFETQSIEVNAGMDDAMFE